MKKYIGTKMLHAVEMTLEAYNEKRGWVIPQNENPDKKGYYVQYLDGYESWSPKETFEESYRLTDAMNFGLATEAAKRGYRVARAGWNGANMYAYIVPAASYPAQTDAARAEFGDMVPYRAYWALKTAQNDVATWTPSGSDTLADDWHIVLVTEKEAKILQENQ